MFLSGLIFALIIAVLVTLAFLPLQHCRSDAASWPGIWAVFLLILLATWAGGLWIVPFGPPAFGVYWIPFLVAGLLAAFLLLALPERRQPPSRQNGDVLARDEEQVVFAFGIFFWLVLLFFVVAIFMRYI